MSRRRRAVALSGLAVVGVYVASALLSGHLSVLARRPLFDGVTPAVPYKWVDPPRALAGSNQDPSSGSFQVELTAAGSKTAVLTTDDAQVTLILAKGAFASAKGQAYVQVALTPLAPKAVSAPAAPLKIAGNVIHIEATYQPSGDAVDLTAGTARIVLVYPLTLGAGDHTIVASADGDRWSAPDTNDLPSIQQADALIDSLGYAAVATTPHAPTASSGGTDSGGSSAATIAIVAGLVVLTAAAIVVLRRGSSSSAMTPEERRRRDERRKREERRRRGTPDDD